MYYSTGHKYCNSFSSYFPDKSHFLPYNLCIVYHVEIHQNSSGNVAIFMTGTVYTSIIPVEFLWNATGFPYQKWKPSGLEWSFLLQYLWPVP